MGLSVSLVIPANDEEGAIAAPVREAVAGLPKALLAGVIVVGDELSASRGAFERRWITRGFAAQGPLTARFPVRIFASERARRSGLPENVWCLSIPGSTLRFARAVRRQDPVVILGRACGLLVRFGDVCLVRVARRASLLPDDR